MELRDVFHKLIDRAGHNSETELREMHDAITSAFETDEEREAREKAEAANAVAAESVAASGPTDAEIEAEVEKRVAAKLAEAEKDKTDSSAANTEQA